MNQTSLRNTERKYENNSFEKCHSSPEGDETKFCSKLRAQKSKAHKLQVSEHFFPPCYITEF